MACRKCRRDHAPVTLAEWSWRMRDHKPKPRGATVGIVWTLAAILDPATGCGWASRATVADKTGESEAGVKRALRWAQDQFLIVRVKRGNRVTDDRMAASEWRLIGQTQHRNDAALAHTQGVTHDPLAQTPEGSPVTRRPRPKGSPMTPQERPGLKERPKISLPPAALDDETRVIRLAKKHLGQTITSEQAGDLLRELGALGHDPIRYLIGCMTGDPASCLRIIAGDYVPHEPGEAREVPPNDEGLEP
jgi:hypothetical protein